MPKLNVEQSLKAVQKIMKTGAMNPAHESELLKAISDARANKAVRRMYVTGSATQTPEAVMASRQRPLAQDLDVLYDARSEHPGSGRLDTVKPIHSQWYDSELGYLTPDQQYELDMRGREWPGAMARFATERRGYPAANWRRVLGLSPVSSSVLMGEER